MMTGRVTKRRVIVEIPLLLSNGGAFDVAHILDTGFEGMLTLPPETVAGLKLPYSHPMKMTLPDGRQEWFDVHLLVIAWHGAMQTVGAMRTVDALAINGERLLGTTLLEDSIVSVDFTENGVVTITPRLLTAT